MMLERAKSCGKCENSRTLSETRKDASAPGLAENPPSDTSRASTTAFSYYSKCGPMSLRTIHLRTTRDFNRILKHVAFLLLDLKWGHLTLSGTRLSLTNTGSLRDIPQNQRR